MPGTSTLMNLADTRWLAYLWMLCKAFVLGLASLVVLVTGPLAAADWDKLHSLAQQRYGTSSATTVSAWRKMVEESRALPDADKLAKVNTFFNRQMVYDTDAVIWQQEDYWATPLEFMGRGSGDCEDFAIAKYITLRLLGVSDPSLRLIYVRAKTGATTSVAHMVLGFYPEPSQQPMILDNLITSVRLASQRPDLSPVFSFNSSGLWAGGATSSLADPTTRLSRWRDVLERMHQDGLTP